jgi:hypothetical protein
MLEVRRIADFTAPIDADKFADANTQIERLPADQALQAANQLSDD